MEFKSLEELDKREVELKHLLKLDNEIQVIYKNNRKLAYKNDVRTDYILTPTLFKEIVTEQQLNFINLRPFLLKKIRAQKKLEAEKVVEQQ